MHVADDKYKILFGKPEETQAKWKI